MNDKILLGHGSGGKLSHELISQLFIKYFDNPALNQGTDSAILNLDSKNIAFTTDSFVVDPIFFPGGDIGKLAICGTVNDLAVSGAEPLWLSASFIIEEGFLLSDLEKIVKSMTSESKKANIRIVTGDTKVVEKNKCDKIFITTSGIGCIPEKYKGIGEGRDIKTGDKIIINGSIGDHGMSIMSARNELTFRSDIKSDCACLNHMIQKALQASQGIKFMRDATRGGVATVLTELVNQKEFGIEIFEEKIHINEQVKGLCEILGFDPMYVANEGKVIMVVEEKSAQIVIDTLKQDKLGLNSEIIGEIVDQHYGKGWINTGIGGRRIIDMLSGEQLPRIC